jgi:hypothetical protein
VISPRPNGSSSSLLSPDRRSKRREGCDTGPASAHLHGDRTQKVALVDDCTGVLNWAVLRAVLAERPGIRLPRSVAGAARGAASSRGSWDHPGLHWQQALALHFLARELAGAAALNIAKLPELLRE